MLAALGVSNTQLGLISTIRTIFGLICMIPGGWICDKFDTKKVLIICSLGIVPFTVLEVLTVDIYWLQVVSFCGMAGCTNLGFWPATLKAVRIIGGKEHQSSSFGVFEAVQGLIASLGNSLALVVFAWFVNSVAGYKAAMLSMAVYIVLCAVFVPVSCPKYVDAIHPRRPNCRMLCFVPFGNIYLAHQTQLFWDLSI